MIIALDTETYKKTEKGLEPTLDTRQFTIGCVITEANKIAQIYYTPEDMWQGIQKTIQACEKRGLRAQIYAHHHEYDILTYGRNHLEEIHQNTILTNPLIMKWRNHYFLDSIAFYKKPLHEIGETLGKQKLEMPETPQKPEDLIPYVIRDTEIVLQAMIKIRETIKKLGHNPRKMLTAGQLTMTNFKTFIKNNKLAYLIMNKGEMYKTGNTQLTRQALRGGRNEAFQTGIFKKATLLDINKHYANTMINMKFPDLRKERCTLWNKEKIEIDEIRDLIGVIKCTVKPNTKILPYLPISIPHQGKRLQVYPQESTMKGVWTILEIAKAQNLGYEIHDIEWTVLYPELRENPLKAYVKNLIKIAKQHPELEKELKSMPNNLFGKFAQRNKEKEILILPRAETRKKQQEGFKIVGLMGEKFVLEREGDYIEPKFTNPIISTMITATARDKLYSELIKIPREDLLYTDTDSIMFKQDHIDKFKTGTEIGEWKIVEEQQPAKILGEKRYYIGQTLKLSGIPKRMVSKQLIDQEKSIEVPKITSLRQAIIQGNIQLAGTFTPDEITINQGAKLAIPLPSIIEEKWRE